VNKCSNRSVYGRYLAVLATALIVGAADCASAAWTRIALPNLSNWGGARFAHLSSGQLVYGENNKLYLQSAWGSSSFSQYGNATGLTFDPSFIARSPSGSTVFGAGGYSGSSALHRIDQPASTASTFSTPVAAVLNYDGLFRDDNDLFVAGSSSSVSNSLRRVSIDGAVDQLLIEDISQYGSGIALDAAGNLYTGSESGAVYRFSKSLLDQAIADNDLLRVDSPGVELVANFALSVGSLAVDSNGVLWAAGWNANGIAYFDGSSYGSIVPGPDNGNYTIGTFSYDGSEYLAYLNNEGWFNGAPLSYGYATSASAIPEPTAAVSLLFGACLLGMRRLRRVVREHVG